MQATTDRILPGVALMLGFCLLAPLIDVSSKLAADTISIGQITFARFLVQGVLMLPILIWMGQGFALSRRGWGLILLRSVAAVVSTFAFVWALFYMPLADALAIVFVEPFILLLLGWLIFKDEVGPRRILACGVGFLGALLVIQPAFAAFGWVPILPLITALAFAVYILITREASRLMTPEAMQFHTAWVAGLICVPFLGYGIWENAALFSVTLPEGAAWLWLFGVGAAATVSHMMMSYALKFAPSATLAPLHYLEIVSAAALGYLVFGDFPNMITWLGIAIIVSSGLYIIHRERVTARQARRAMPSAAG